MWRRQARLLRGWPLVTAHLSGPFLVPGNPEFGDVVETELRVTAPEHPGGRGSASFSRRTGWHPDVTTRRVSDPARGDGHRWCPTAFWPGKHPEDLWQLTWVAASGSSRSLHP